MNLLIGCPKGGTGKSTLATNLAAYAAHAQKDVLLLDLDSQASSRRWCERRASLNVPPVPVAQLSGDVTGPARDLARRFGNLVMDAAGRNGPELRTAARVADVWFVPVRPGIADLETLNDVVDILSAARIDNPKLRVEVVMSCVSTHYGSREVFQARHAIQASFPELPVSAQFIRDRKTYRDAAAVGASVLEGKSPARAEIQLLAQSVFTF